MSHEEKLAKLAEQLRQILRQHGLQADIDRDKLADAFDWAATLYAWETDAEPKEPPNREEIEALPDALQRLQMLLANQSNISWLAVAIAAIETEEFGAPVERFCPIPGSVMQGPNAEWVARIAEIAAKLEETLCFLATMEYAASLSLSRATRNRGPEQGKRDLRGAVAPLAAYWEKVLRLKFTVTFQKDGDRLYASSAAAKFITEAVKLIDVKRRPEELRHVMNDTRRGR